MGFFPYKYFRFFIYVVLFFWLAEMNTQQQIKYFGFNEFEVRISNDAKNGEKTRHNQVELMVTT